MCDQTEIPYVDGDVVWVKLGKCFWPGQVRDVDKLSEEILESFKKKPIAAVQFFDEDTYEYVKNLEQIFTYNGRKKLEFIKKGLDMFRNQKEGTTFMNKFPEDVKKAEILTGGDPDIILDPQFIPKEKPSYRDLFVDNKSSSKKDKAKNSRGRPSTSANGRKSLPSSALRTPQRPITHPRFIRGETDHDVRIRHQNSVEDTSFTFDDTPKSKVDSSPYKCQLCNFTSNRLNVIVLHNKFHSGETESKSKGKGSVKKTNPVKSRATPASPVAKPKAKAKTKIAVEEPPVAVESSSAKSPSPLKAGLKRKLTEILSTEKQEKKPDQTIKSKVKETPEKKQLVKAVEKVNDKKSVTKIAILGKRRGPQGIDKTVKKSKNDLEIRETLLADWDDEDGEEELEVEQLKKKLPVVTNKLNSDENTVAVPVEVPSKVASCFDFEDSKDAILDRELEERAKKFVEGRKFPRIVDEKVEKIIDIDKESEQPAEPAPTDLNDTEKELPPAASAEDFDKAIDNLLAETSVPSLPQVPLGVEVKSSLPDVVLDSAATDIKSTPDVEMPSLGFGSGDHDYSAKKKLDTAPLMDDILDINSMPVVMTDDITSEELSFNQDINNSNSKIDLIPNSDDAEAHTIVFSEGELKMPTSVKSVVKAVRTTTADRSKVILSKNTVSSSNMLTKSKLSASKPTLVKPIITAMTTLTSKSTVTTVTKPILSKATVVQKGIAGGKYIIVQSPSGQQSRLTLAPQKSMEAFSGSPQVVQSTSGAKVVILSKPPGQPKKAAAPLSSQQRVLTSSSKLQPNQRIMTSTGQILTQVSPRGGVPPGAKLTQITGQQIRALTPTGKQVVGGKMSMQSLQTKVCLPSLQPVRVSSPGGIRMVNTTKPNTILVQATQGGSSISKQSPALQQRLLTPRPRLLKNPPQTVTATPPSRPVPKILQSRSTLQPRIIGHQKPRVPSNTGIVQPVNQVTGFTTQPHIIQKISQPQVPLAKKTSLVPQSQLKKITQPVQRVAITQPKPLQLGSRQVAAVPKQSVPKVSVPPPPITIAENVIELPPLTPIQSATLPSDLTLTLPITSSLTLPNFPTSTIDTSGNTVLTSEQLAQVMASTTANQLVGDAGTGATYVLLTIDEAGNLHPYNQQSLISYDGTDQSGQTLYIDSSSLETSGDLDNMILTIDNSTIQGGSGLSLNLGGSNDTSMYDMRMPSASQDILAAALANTDVFQPEVTLQDPMAMTSCVVDTSSLLASIPSTLLLPSLNRVVTAAANVSETSLTLNQPIMSPLEVSSNTTSFRAPPSISAPQPSTIYTTVSESMLAPLDISSQMVTSVFTSSSDHQTTTESDIVPFHPSMPLLSEEPGESSISINSDSTTFKNSSFADTNIHMEPTETYEQLTFQTESVLNNSEQTSTPDDVKTTLNESVELSHFTPQEFRDDSVDESDQPVVATSASDISSSETHTDLGSIDTFLSESTLPNASSIAQSMPLLSDDLACVDNEDQVDVMGNKSGSLEDLSQDFLASTTEESKLDESER